MTSFARIFAIEVLTIYCLGCLGWTRRAPMPAILFQMKHPKNVFGRWRVPVKFTGKSDVIFSGPKLSCALRNTRKSFRELYGTVFGPEKFSGLLRNARQVRLNKLSAFTVSTLRTMCKHFELSFRSKDNKPCLMDKIKEMVRECSCSHLGPTY